MGNEFPGTHITSILAARKLRQAEGAVFVSNGCLGTRTTQRRSWREQLREPPLIIRMLFILRVGFELKACDLKVA